MIILKLLTSIHVTGDLGTGFDPPSVNVGFCYGQKMPLVQVFRRVRQLSDISTILPTKS